MLIFEAAKPVIIFGGSGVLGNNLTANLKANGIHVLNINRVELGEYLQIDSLVRLLTTYNPGALINCMAMTGLDKCLLNREAAIFANSEIPLLIAGVAKKIGIPLIHFSTDNIFSGQEEGILPTELSRPCPVTWYGMTKYLGELNTAVYENALIVRMPMLFGSINDQQLISRLVSAAMASTPVQAATDVFSTPTYIPDVASWVVRLLENKISVETSLVHLSSDRSVSIYEFMFDVFQILKLEKYLLPASSDFFAQVEIKPRYGGLSSIITTPFSYHNSVKSYSEQILSRRKKS